MAQAGAPHCLPSGLQNLQPLDAEKFIIKGSAGSGKTEFVMQVAIKLILPSTDWFGVRFGGMEHHVLWIDCDMKFSVERFSSLLKYSIENSIRQTELEHRDDSSFLDSLGRSITTESVSELVEACLGRLHYVAPADNVELRVLFSSFPTSLANLAPPPTSWALVADAVDAFFRLERLEQIKPIISSDSRTKLAPMEDLIGHLVALRTFKLTFCTASSKFHPSGISAFELDSSGRKLSYCGRQYSVTITRFEGFTVSD
eukprot:TRINITY_DN1285_c0_g1_i1.p2 TRINITY_DN1285_c0_g1~~TRINITY_DN1285_c0_g1_i1.p2  ORF type:complete len:257 (+),score=37.74 TRINITY_DN1285_c0_g1_i1:57-827(+)